MNMSKFIGSKFLGAADYPNPAVLTIVQVSEEEIGQEDDRKRKGVVYFENVEKALVLNATNTTTLIELLGEESDAWLGQKIEIFTDPKVMFAGKRTPALRLRAPKQVVPPKANGNPTNLVTDDPDLIPDPGAPMSAKQRQAANRQPPF